MTTLSQRFDCRHHQLFDLPLPNGVSMKVCCDSAPNCHADDLFGNVCWFHTSLFFPIDDAISTYLEARDKYSAEQNYPLTAKEEMVVLDGVAHYPIGHLTVEIRVANTYGRLCINTVSMSQNEMMLHSVSIRNAMKQLLCAHEGVVGLIDLVADDYRYPLLLKPDHFIQLTAEWFEEANEDVDQLVRDIRPQLPQAPDRL